MNPPIDTACFQLGVPPGDDIDEEGALLRELEERALAYVTSRSWAPPVRDMLLAFGVGGVIGLFLVRFARGLPGEGQGDTERWVVVGDMPTMNFETDARTPAEALQLYCAIAEDWADNVLAGRDLADSYPIPVAPTREYGEMLKSRVGSIRKMFVPIAGATDRIAAEPI